MNWLTSALIAAALFSTSNALTNVFQSKMSMGAGLTLFSAGVFACALIIAAVLKTSFQNLSQSGTGIYFALGSGIVWALAQMTFLLMLSKNPPLSIVVPIVVGGIGVGGVITGALFFGEQLSTMRVIGAAIILLGTVILARS